jgi:hypothetical protein
MNKSSTILKAGKNAVIMDAELPEIYTKEEYSRQAV